MLGCLWESQHGTSVSILFFVALLVGSHGALEVSLMALALQHA